MMGRCMRFLVLLALYHLTYYLSKGNALTLQTCSNCKNTASCTLPVPVNNESGKASCLLACSTITENETCVWDSSTLNCGLYSCQNITPSPDHTLYRQSVYTDCPNYRIGYKDKGKGSCPIFMSMNGTSYDACVIKCLDTDECRGFTFNYTKAHCDFHNCNDFEETNFTEIAFFKRICEPLGQVCDVISSMKTCYNCNISSDGIFVSNSVKDRPECWATCQNKRNCVTEYRPHTGMCWKYNSVEVQEFTGRIAYRPSCSDTCTNFTVHELLDHQGTCGVIDVKLSVSSTYHCLSLCLDIDGCRGVTYDNTTQLCYYHDCNNSTAVNGLSFVGLDCNIIEACNETHVQKCIDCSQGNGGVVLQDTSSSSGYGCRGVTIDSPGDICSVYEHGNRLCSTYETCDAITPAEGFNTYRKSCSSACLNYKIEVLKRHDALGEVMTVHVNVPTLNECQLRCLDMDGCRGALYHFTTRDCKYYNSSDAYYNGSIDITFITRICDYTECAKTEYQRCIDCSIDDIPYLKNQWYPNTDQADCENLCIGKTNKSCSFNPYFFECRAYNSSRIKVDEGYTTFRETCTTDCPSFRLERLEGHEGTCGIMTAEWDRDAIDCVNRCLDMTGCRGVTFNSSNNGCYYHSCSSNIPSANPNVEFYKRDCDFQPMPNCTPSYTQTCVNCKPYASCDEFNGNYNTSSVSSCEWICKNILTTSLCVFGPLNGRCKPYRTHNCSQLIPTEGYSTIRKSCSADCPYFKLTKMPGYSGTCATISTDNYTTSYFECQERCFDMDGCRGVTFTTGGNTCIYHNCSDAATGASDETFIKRDCDYQECNRDYTKSCRRCKKSSTCGSDVATVFRVQLDYNCSDVCRNFTNCTTAVYTRQHNRCQLYGCLEVEAHDMQNLVTYRESCNNDCPDFELKLYEDTRGTGCVVIGNSGFDVISKYQYCISRCLDIDGCRATDFNSTTRTCYFYSSCGGNSVYVGDTFGEIICTPEPVKLYTQTCFHCELDAVACSGNFTLTTGSSRYTKCKDRCENLTDCHTAVYSGLYGGLCSVYQCSLITMMYGYITYRKTNNSDCLNYDIRVYDGYVGNCSAMANSNESSSSYCLSNCLDTPLCRGVSYNKETKSCRLHECTSMVAAAYPLSDYTVFIERVCPPDECSRDYNQTCIDCQGSDYCQGPIYSNDSAIPSSVLDQSLLGAESITSIWYSAESSQARYVDCHWVNMALGDTLYRRTCAPDCPVFEIFIVPDSFGTCNVTHTILGGIALDHCLELCLDTPGCLGATYEPTSCELHDCNTYTYNSSAQFINRRCIDTTESCEANVTQTCINCDIGINCMMPFNESTPIYFEHECLDLKQSVDDSLIVEYSRPSSACNMYECKQVGYRLGDVLYRKSCNQECPVFEMFLSGHRNGTCEIIGYHEGGLNIDYCIEKCIDLPGCLGTTFNEELQRCTYHNCTDSDRSESSIFARRVCLNETLPRLYTQTCFNCKIGAMCQSHYHPYPDQKYYKYEHCFGNVSTYDTVSWAEMYHNESTGLCYGFNCTFVEQMETHYGTIKRRSPVDDCPNFEIYTIKQAKGNCTEIASDIGSWLTVEYCISKCLDIEGCRGVTRSWQICSYHNCTEYIDGGNTFIMRKCFDPANEPARNIIQTCVNCNNDCFQPYTNIQSGVLKSRSGECAFIEQAARSLVHTLSNGSTCYEYNCDQPNLMDRSQTVIRKTHNPDCQKFEVFALEHAEHAESWEWEHVHYEEGIYSRWVCLQRCMDLPGCRAADWYSFNKKCRYYNSTGYYLSNTTGITHFEKECINLTACTPTYQQCLNCDISSECLPIATSTTMDVNDCSSACAGNTDCNTAVLDSVGTCSMYECDRIVQSDGDTVVLRQACDNMDCPLYEIYSANDEEGTCYAYMEEYYVPYAYLCMKRCMNMPDCRAITHYPNEDRCSYHRCDCSAPYSGTATFMWKYCLEGTVNKTVIPANCTTGDFCSGLYPPRLVLDCDTTTVSQIVMTSTTPTPTTTANITALQIGAIFLWPCLCGTGEFINWTDPDIAAYLSDSIWIDKRYTSKARRLKLSSPDYRWSAKVLGGSGVAILLIICLVFFTLDSRYWYKSLIRFGRLPLRIAKYFKKKRIASKSKRFSIIAEVGIAANDDFDDTLIDLENESQNHDAHKGGKSDKPSSSKLKRNKYDVLVDPLDCIEPQITEVSDSSNSNTDEGPEN